MAAINSVLLGRQKALCLTTDVFFIYFFFILPPDHRPQSADHRETLPHYSPLRELYYAGPKINSGMSPEKLGPKHAKFGAILYNFQKKIKGEHIKLGLKFSVFSLYAYNFGVGGSVPGP